MRTQTKMTATEARTQMPALWMALGERRRDQAREVVREWLSLSADGRCVDADECWRTLEMLVPVETAAVLAQVDRPSLAALVR